MDALPLRITLLSATLLLSGCVLPQRAEEDSFEDSWEQGRYPPPLLFQNPRLNPGSLSPTLRWGALRPAGTLSPASGSTHSAFAGAALWPQAEVASDQAVAAGFAPSSVPARVMEPVRRRTSWPVTLTAEPDSAWLMRALSVDPYPLVEDARIGRMLSDGVGWRFGTGFSVSALGSNEDGSAILCALRRRF